MSKMTKRKRKYKMNRAAMCVGFSSDDFGWALKVKHQKRYISKARGWASR